MAVTMSKKDKDALAAAGAAWNAANAAGDKAGMEKAHADAEAIRANYGYSGGADGSEYIPISGGNSQYTGVGDKKPSVQKLPVSSGGTPGGGFNALAESLGIGTGSRPSYKSEYGSRIDAMLDEILNREKFSYDAQADPMFQQYQAMYNREGQRAVQDTLAAAASGAGGMNSYAITAAQQAGDYYSAQLMDRYPELYQMAYEMYLADIDNQVRDLGLLQDMDETQYNRYRDTMDDWENDRNFAYEQYRDDVADSQWQTSFDYGVQRDEIEDQRYDEQWQHQLDREAIEDERYDTEWEYGVQRDEIEDAKDAQKGSGGSGGSPAAPAKPTLTAAQTLSALENGVINETTMAAYEYYFGEPYEDGSTEETAPGDGFTGSSGYNNVLATIDRAPGLTKYDKLNIVEDAYNNGRLTDEEAERLLNHIDEMEG